MRAAGGRLKVLRLLLLACDDSVFGGVCCPCAHWCFEGLGSLDMLCRYRHVGPPIYFSRRGMQLNERPWHKQSVLMNNPR